MRTLAVIPARAGSKRIPDKNLRHFLGRPLVSWSLLFAKEYAGFNHVHLCTDSEALAAEGRLLGLHVPFLRSAASATDEATSVDAVIEVLDRFEQSGLTFDTVALLQPTTPYRCTKLWDEALSLLDDPEVDSVVSGRPTADHPWHSFRIGEGASMEHFFGPAERSARSQDLPNAYVVNGSLYLARCEALRRHRNFTAGNCRAVICEQAAENIDIDTPEDWDEAEIILGGVLN